MSQTASMARPATVPCPFCEQLNRVDLARLTDGPKCGGCGRPPHLDRPLKATEADFDRTIQSPAVAGLVGFYAHWCGPCRMMGPTPDEVAHDPPGAALVLKVDSHPHP